jgi:MoxR-like ATPase
MQPTAKRLTTIADELTDQFLERTATVRALLVAMLAGQHAFLLGPPGTAKSQLARALTGRVHGAVFWETLVDRFSDPQHIFGPLDLAALKQGRYRHATAGHAAEAHIGFVDEIFKCNSASLNAMLAWLNERMFHNGGEVMACPLIFAVGASNELPSGEETAAIWDRLLVRLEVGYLQDPSNFALLVRSAVVDAPAPIPTTVDLADLVHAIRVDVPAVAVPDGVVDAIGQLRAELRQQELIVSDRRWRQCVRLLQASAYLAERDAVAADDLAILTTTLWERPEHRTAVERQVMQHVNPNAREALELRDAVEEVNAELTRRLQEVQGQSNDRHLAVVGDWVIREANQKLSGARRRVKELQRESEAAGRSTATIEEIHARTIAVYKRLLAEGLGQDPSTIEIKD